MSGPRMMRLTREHVVLCHRDVVESPVRSPYDYFEDADYDRAIDHVLSGRPEGPVWLFAYGSLIWKPEVPHVDLKPATALGWHRAFSMKITSHRGTPEQPGYMMCLNPGGRCEGVILQLAEEDLWSQIDKLLNRELGSHEALDAVRWIPVETSAGLVKALTFYAHPHLLNYYEAATPPQHIAHALARACGHWGSGAEYLFNTVSHLEELGIHDEGLWQLQEMVAAEIEAIYGVGQG